MTICLLANTPVSSRAVSFFTGKSFNRSPVCWGYNKHSCKSCLSSTTHTCWQSFWLLKMFTLLICYPYTECESFIKHKSLYRYVFFSFPLWTELSFFSHFSKTITFIAWHEMFTSKLFHILSITQLNLFHAEMENFSYFMAAGSSLVTWFCSVHVLPVCQVM